MMVIGLASIIVKTTFAERKIIFQLVAVVFGQFSIVQSYRVALQLTSSGYLKLLSAAFLLLVANLN